MRDHLRAALLLAGTALSSPAMAQDALPEGEGQEIVVTGQRGALNEAVEHERRADNLVNIVTSDDVGQFGDQNTAEALQRLPGVTIGRNEGEGRTVSVRGLPSGFTQVTINGARVGTSEPGSSTVALDVVPADVLGQIELNKTYTPDMDGDTIGGAVELKSLSAFQRSGPITSLRVEGSISEYVGTISPKASASFARRLFDDTLGIALTASYFKRFIDGDDLRNESSLLPITRSGVRYFYPGEVNQRFEIGVRERIGGTANIEFRPDADQEYYLRAQFTQLDDDDIRVQSQWQTERATGSEVQVIEDGFAQLIDVRQRNQIFFQPTRDRLWTVSVGNRNRFGAFEFSTQFDYARTRWAQEDGVRGRFEIDDIGVRTRFGRETSYIESFRDRTRPDPADLRQYLFTNLLFIEEERIDEIATGRADLRYDLSADSYLKFGVKHRMRDKSADKSEFNGNPRSIPEFQVNLSQFNLLTGANTRFRTFGPFPSIDAARDLFFRARDGLLTNPNFQRQDNSVAADYVLGEDVTSGYGMVSLDLSPAFKVIGGVRAEHTRFSSQGFFIETNADGLNPAGVPLTPVDLGTYSRSYTDWLPSLVLRWEPTNTVLARASYGRGVKRPEFEDSVNSQVVSFTLLSGAGQPEERRRELTAGNPFLNTLTSNNFDASLAWFPTRGTALQAAFFHKEISNFFIGLRLNALTPAERSQIITQTPIQLPSGVRTDFDQIDTVVNGASAKVTGVELSLSQTFPDAPGLLAGLFATANVTFATSEAEIRSRPGEQFPFPGQADLSGNVSVGYENDVFSLRTSVTHTGSRLQGVGSEPIFDRYRAPYTQTDINIRFNVTDRIQIYGDALNIFAVKDTRYYQGERFGFFERVQDFGPTYQVGARVTF